MKIKTKLTVALLLIALVPLVVVSVVSFMVTRHSMTHQFLNQLDSLATVQASRVETVVEQQKERLSLLTSRTALRNNLKAFNQTQDEQTRAQISQILQDARSSVATFKDIHVLNPQGIVVASTNPSRIGADLSDEEIFTRGRSAGVVDIFFKDKSGSLMQYLAGPLKLDDELLGVIAVESDPKYLLKITTDYTGLGKTGETVLAMRDSKGNPVFITPLRFDRKAALRQIVPEEKDNMPIIESFSGINTLMENAVDYRGEPVLAATRYIIDPGWGLVTKIDRSEAFDPVNILGILLIGIVSAALATIVLFSLIFARKFTEPLIELTEAAQAVSEGDLSVQASVTSDDEIGQLAAAFNKMTGDLLEARADLERKVEDRTAELAAANAELEGYARTVSHDLKGPLSAVNIAAHLLREQLALPVEHQDSKEFAESFDIMERNLTKSFDLIDDLLALAEAGQVPSHVHPVDVSSVVQTILNERKSMLEEREIQVKAAPDLGHVVGDQTQIYQLFTNLIGNSIKHNTRDEPTIEVLYMGEDEGGAHRYIIRDNGPGIPPESIERLFVPFFKGETGETGIGLTIVDKIIKVYSGKIRAYNDNGACFEFTINDLGKVWEEEF
jgi:signal transduction histidine kinase